MKPRTPAYDPRVTANRLADLVVRRNQVLHQAQQAAAAYHDLVARLDRIGVAARGPWPANVAPGHALGRLQALLTEIENLDSEAAGLDEERARLHGAVQGFLPSLGDRLLGGKREARITEIDGERRRLIEYRAARVAEVRKLAPAVHAALARLAQDTLPGLQELAQTAKGYLEPFSTPAIRGWSDPRWQEWRGGALELSPVLRVGQWTEPPQQVFGAAEVQGLNEALQSSELTFAVPATVPFIGAGKGVVLTCGRGTERLMTRWMQSLILRITTLVPGQATFTLLDPAGRGRAFPFAQFIPNVSENRDDLHHDLLALKERAERVYEESVLQVAEALHLLPPAMLAREPFEFIFVAGFPHGFSRADVALLFEIGRVGPRAGRYLFIGHNREDLLPKGTNWDQFENRVMVDVETGTGPLMEFQFEPDLVPSDPDGQRDLLVRLGLTTPFDYTALWINVVDLPEDRWWRGDTGQRLATPIGGENGCLRVWFGLHEEGWTGQHGWLAGMPDQGQQSLLHGMLLGLAIRYSPADLRFYLVGPRVGAEFAVYRDLPHTALLSLNTDPELARSILAELADEAARRTALFAQHGVAHFSAHRDAKSPGGRLPRLFVLLVSAEELFEDDWKGSAGQVLWRLLQHGNDVGIHVLFNARGFEMPAMHDPAAPLSQCHLRMAMRLPPDVVPPSWAFGPAGRELITRCDAAGKIVVNGRRGGDEDNTCGRVARLPEDPNFVAERVRRLAERTLMLHLDRELPPPVILEGLRQPLLSENRQLLGALERRVQGDPDLLEELAREPVRAGGLGLPWWRAEERPAAMWLGQRFAVHEQALMALRRRPGQHVVIVGEEVRGRYGILAGMLASLPVLCAPREVQVLIFDRSAETCPEGNVLPRISESFLRPLGYPCMHTRDAERLGPAFERLAAQIEERRRSPGERPAVLVVLAEPDRMPLLRRPADSRVEALGPTAAAFHRLLAEGSQHGIHLVVAVSSLRIPGLLLDPRYELRAFGHRIAMRMSEDDSFLLVNHRLAAHLQDHGERPLSAWYHALDGQGDYRFKVYDGTESLADVAALHQKLTRVRKRLEPFA